MEEGKGKLVLLLAGEDVGLWLSSLSQWEGSALGTWLVLYP